MKMVLEAAAKMPAAKGRALIAAVAAKTQDSKTQDAREERMAAAQLLMEAAMVEAALDALEKQISN